MLFCCREARNHMNKELFAIRDFDKAIDFNFIKATWLNGIYYGGTFLSKMEKNLFMTHYSSILDNYLHSKATNIKLAVLKDDPEIIIGYVAYRNINPEFSVLDYVFVKKNYRKSGFSKVLIPSNAKYCTILTALGAKYIKNLQLNPFT